MRWSCFQFRLMFYCCCRNLTDVCLLKQGGSRYPPPLHGQGASLKTILPDMWCEIKQKQQKMPKARANITVYSSRRFSGSSLILSCLTVSFRCGIVYSRVKRTPESEKKTYVHLIKRKIKKKMLVYVPGTYISPFVLALEGSVNSNPSTRERLFLSTAYIPFCSSTRRRCELQPFQEREVILENGKSETGPKQLRTWLTRSVLPHTGDQARSVE